MSPSFTHPMRGTALEGAPPHAMKAAAPRVALYRAAGEEWAFPPGADGAWDCVVRTSDWRVFERAAARVECAIAVMRWLERDAAFERLCTWRAVSRACPVLLVTTKDADNLRALRHLEVEELLWIDDAGEQFAAAVARAREHGFLRRTAGCIDRAEHLSPVLRAALAHAFRAQRPPRTVEELGRILDRNRRTLWYHWNEAVNPDAGVRLIDVLQWLLVLHAANRRAAGWKWTRVADDLGVCQQTLWSTARRLLGVDRRQLSELGPGWVQERFAREVLPVLLGEALDTCR